MDSQTLLQINLAVSVILVILFIVLIVRMENKKSNFDGQPSDPTLAIFNSNSKLNTLGSRSGPQNWQGRVNNYPYNISPESGETQVRTGLTIGSSLALRGAVGGPQDYQ